MSHYRPVAFLLLASFMPVLIGMAQTKRSITAEDCVTVRYLNDDGAYSPLQINRQGTRLAYVVKNPNLHLNRNDIQLYVKNLVTGSQDAGNVVLVADTISQIHWAADGKRLFALTSGGAHVSVSTIDTVTGEHSVAASSSSDIKEYTIDAAGDMIVYAIEDQPGVHVNGPTAKEIAAGYRIPFQSREQTQQLQRHLFMTKRSGSGNWDEPKEISVRSPLTGQLLTGFSFTTSLRLSLSPNGKKLAFTYIISEQERLPVEWTDSLIGAQVLKDGSPPMTVLLIDLSTMQAALPFKTAWAFSIPMWAFDSGSFAIVATSPIGSSWEQSDARDHQDIVGSAHLFWIEPDSGKIEEVTSHVGDILHGPLWWGPKGDMLVETEGNAVTRLLHDGTGWRSAATFRSPPVDGSPYTPVVSDGASIIREREGPAAPPELVRYRLDQPEVTSFAKLDPQFDLLTLAPAKHVEWETSTGYKVSGLLMLPPDYSDDQAYPLVIQAYHQFEKFFCDSGEGHWPSLVPQPLANAGILYLIRTSHDDGYKKEDLDHQPSQYPGGIGEAALQMDIWDSAIKAFSSRGWVDPKHVGIIGFSRTGWYTEFALTHSEAHYAAATVTDNVTYSLGSYFLFHLQRQIRGDDAMYGGPPYGATLKNWLKYSPAFNLEKIHTPVLMEEMGYGVAYDSELAPPVNLTSHYELFTGLNRLNKPVELYYYPLEDHTPDHPQGRLASLQRNVDWYRFWLQGYERPNPEDADQYKRWEALRDLQSKAGNDVNSAGSLPQ
jgi:dipeptidyl aminopeptidase/acylaminoacyl peptidase